MENELQKRKRNRLENYDYNSTGAYFVTICVKDRKPILSDVVLTVGGGAYDAPKIQLTNIGKIVENNLLSSEKISGVTIDNYVIMPDHIHVIIFLDLEKYKDVQNGSSGVPTPTVQNGSSRAPTPTVNAMLPRVISAFKRFCGKNIGENVFQRGYMEHIIRDKYDYETRVKYIYENPTRWYYGKNKE